MGVYEPETEITTETEMDGSMTYLFAALGIQRAPPTLLPALTRWRFLSWAKETSALTW